MAKIKDKTKKERLTFFKRLFVRTVYMILFMATICALYGIYFLSLMNTSQVLTITTILAIATCYLAFVMWLLKAEGGFDGKNKK